jgi:hypothetical protein
MKYLKFNQDQYGVDGLIGLVAGDDWQLKAQVIDINGTAQEPASLSDVVGASAFFPAASGGSFAGVVQINNAQYGWITLSAASGNTVGAQLSDVGLIPFITVQDSVGLQTIISVDQPLKIQQRGSFSY